MTETKATQANEIKPAERRWTDAQQAAIDARSGTILVSAAAGSGKTAVLTQRIIESILDANDPLDLTDLLVVTFSRAAAAELKSRIGDAIRKQLAADPSNRRLRRQQIGLERAEISTIDSFCLKIVGEGAASLGLPAGLRVSDSAESKLLMHEVLDRLLEEEYRRADPSFIALINNFVTSGDGEFVKKLLKLYTKVTSLPEGVGIFGIFADELEDTDRTTFLEGPFGKLLAQEVAYIGAHYKNEYLSVLRYLETEELYQGPLGVFERELDYIERMTAPFASFDELCQYILGYKAETMASVKTADKTPEYLATDKVRKSFKEDMKKLKETYFGGLLTNLAEDSRQTAKLVRSIADLFEKFDKMLMAEKLRRGSVDFADMARFAHKLLVENGQPTAFARAVSGRYRQIYIDEYQDVNRIQDEIFAAIASDNRFMVGDIKQSIYGFRGAEPSIFADYRKKFSDEANDEGRMIFLSNNFRCDSPIIDFTNEVCRKLFVSRGAEVPYEEADELKHSKVADSPRGQPVQIALISSAENDENPEAEYVAGEIDRLIREEGYRPEEIAILLRSAKESAPIYESALAKHGIACTSKTGRPFFEEPEVLLAIALLECIDNPRRDVYCSGALMSPVFGFTLNDLVGRFKVGEGECLFDLLSAAEDDERIASFLAWFEDCRVQSTRLASDEMIQFVYHSTSLPAIVGADAKRGREAVKNLNKLYDLARKCEKNSFMGLHRFLQFVADAAESGETIKSDDDLSSDSTVKIITVHQSKGLEFPVCFLSESMKGANMEDSREGILFEKTMGMAVSLRDESGYVHYNTLLRKMLAKKLIDTLLEQEMRTLYVALTRAKERLYITARANDPEKLLSECQRLQENYSAYAIEHRAKYFYWIMGALDENSQSYRLILPSQETCDEAANSDRCEGFDEGSAEDARMPTEEESVQFECIKQRMNYTYPAERLKDLPTKLTVSTLKPDLLDEDREMNTEPLRAVEKPSFLQTGADARPIGAERGTATHVFMQFCDFDAVEREGVNAELCRLTDRGFMSADMAKVVYKDKIERFFDSALYREMREASLIKREFRFNVYLPATDFTGDREYADALADTRLLVQGVIDCFFMKADGTLKLIDYKTDRVGSSPDETAAILLERYGNQLRYYRMALEELTGKRVSEVALYSFWQSKVFSYPELLTVNDIDVNGS